MLPAISIIFVTVLSLVDLTLTTVTFCHGVQFDETFSHAIAEYSFTSSVFELWCLSIIRTAIILGTLIGICVSRGVGISKVKNSNRPILAICGLQCMLTLIKLLAISEKEHILLDKWFWGLWGWSLVGSSPLLFLEWKILGKVNLARRVRGLNINGNEVKPEECESLLGNDGKREDNNNTGKFL